MTISEQIREAALYSPEPWNSMGSSAFMTCCGFKIGNQSLSDMTTTDLRTFMLLVAEALE